MEDMLESDISTYLTAAEAGRECCNAASAVSYEHIYLYGFPCLATLPISDFTHLHDNETGSVCKHKYRPAPVDCQLTPTRMTFLGNLTEGFPTAIASWTNTSDLKLETAAAMKGQLDSASAWLSVGSTPKQDCPMKHAMLANGLPP